MNHYAWQALSSSYSTVLCGPRGAGAFVQNAEEIAEIDVAPLGRYLLQTQWASLRLAQRHRPDVVYSGSGLTAPAALMAAVAVNARSVCFLHGLDIVADHPVYRRLFLPAIRRIDRILVNSSHTAGLAEKAGVRPERIHIVHPGVALLDSGNGRAAREAFRMRLGIGERPMLLAAGRLTQRKGIAEFVRHALPVIRERLPNVLFAVIGAEANQALKHREGVLAAIERAVVESGSASNVMLLGPVSDDHLSEAYFSADAMVFPVLDLPGDVEGFGMVALEAAAHGLPTVAFAVGGVPDAVAEGRSGYLIQPGDYAAMGEKLGQVLQSRDSETWQVQCREHAEKFVWDTFGERLCVAVG